MEILIIIIISLIICILVGKICYKIGNEGKRVENEHLLREQDTLLKNLDRLQTECDEKLNFIDSAADRAESVYNKALIQLQKELDLRKEQIDKYLEGYSKEVDIKKEQLTKDITELQNHKRAIIEANNKALLLQQEKDNYRLVLTNQEKADIKVLESIRYILHNPRILSMLIWQTYYQPKAKILFAKLLGNQKVCGVYKITNTNTDQCYIGQAVDVRERWLQHCKCGLGIDTPQKNKLYEAMQKDGLENFTFELLQKCSQEELNKTEKSFINLWNSCDFGYNSNTGVQ